VDTRITMEEERKVEVLYQFVLPDNRLELARFQYADRMLSTLWEIENHCRHVIKYQDEYDAYQLAEEIRKLVWEIPIEDLTE